MGQLFGVLLLVGFLCVWWKPIVLVVGVVCLVRWGCGVWRRWVAEGLEYRRGLLEVAARADVQHEAVLRGDESGVFGVAWPVQQKFEGLVAGRLYH